MSRGTKTLFWISVSALASGSAPAFTLYGRNTTGGVVNTITCADAPHTMAAERRAPAKPIQHQSNRLAKPSPRVHDAREWCRSTSVSSFGSLQNRSINDQGKRQANPLTPLNLISDQTLIRIGERK
jgi:hypothetical protein